MLLSLKSEMILKQLINSKNKKQEIDNISKILENRHKQMAETFVTDYSKVIEKCNTLQQLNSHLEAHNKNCLEIIDSIRNAHLQQLTISEQYKSIMISINRLNKLQNGIIQVYDFLKDVKKLTITNDIFNSVQIIQMMEEKKGYFKKYNFYCQLNEIYFKSKTHFTTQILNKAINNLRNKDFITLGKSMDLKYNLGLFQELVRWRREIMGSDFFKITFAVKKLNIEDKFICKIIDEFYIHLQKISNKYCKSNNNITKNINSNNKIDIQDNFVYFSMSALIFDNCLTELFVNYKPLSSQILDLLKKIKIYDIKALIPLKQIITELKIDVSELSTIVETATYDFFNKHFNHKDFFKQIIDFIDFSCQFLYQMAEFSDELSEILANRIDTLLLNHFFVLSSNNMSNTSFNEFIIFSNTVINHLLNNQISLVSFDFKIRIEIDRIANKLINHQIDKFKLIFKNQNIEKIIKSILELKNFLTSEYQIILINKIIKNLNLWGSNLKNDDLLLIKDTIKRNFI